MSDFLVTPAKAQICATIDMRERRLKDVKKRRRYLNTITPTTEPHLDKWIEAVQATVLEARQIHVSLAILRARLGRIDAIENE